MEVSGSRDGDAVSGHGFTVMTVVTTVALTWVHLSPSGAWLSPSGSPCLHVPRCGTCCIFSVWSCVSFDGDFLEDRFCLSSVFMLSVRYRSRPPKFFQMFRNICQMN